jgi:hypothetical protein
MMRLPRWKYALLDAEILWCSAVQCQSNRLPRLYPDFKFQYFETQLFTPDFVFLSMAVAINLARLTSCKPLSWANELIVLATNQGNT